MSIRWGAVIIAIVILMIMIVGAFIFIPAQNEVSISSGNFIQVDNPVLSNMCKKTCNEIGGTPKGNFIDTVSGIKVCKCSTITGNKDIECGICD